MSLEEEETQRPESLTLEIIEQSHPAVHQLKKIAIQENWGNQKYLHEVVLLLAAGNYAIKNQFFEYMMSNPAKVTIEGKSYRYVGP